MQPGALQPSSWPLINAQAAPQDANPARWDGEGGSGRGLQGNGRAGRVANQSRNSSPRAGQNLVPAGCWLFSSASHVAIACFLLLCVTLRSPGGVGFFNCNIRASILMRSLSCRFDLSPDFNTNHVRSLPRGHVAVYESSTFSLVLPHSAVFTQTIPLIAGPGSAGQSEGHYRLFFQSSTPWRGLSPSCTRTTTLTRHHVSARRAHR